MGAGKQAVINAKQMVAKVEKIGKSLGLNVTKNVHAGKTLWATDRRIKVVLEHASTRGKTKKARVGIDCICQDGPGTANVKFFGKMEDTKKYPMKGILVYAGPGFKPAFEGVMDSRGAIPLSQLKQWLETYYNI